MKRIKLLLGGVLTLGVATMSAAPLSVTQALQRASATTIAARYAHDNNLKYTASDLVYTSVTSDGNAAYYVFGHGDNGFMIVSGDDVAVPVLGYTTSGEFDYNNLPDNMRWWLSEYTREIEAAARQAGRMVMTGETRPQRASIAPLCATKWNQDSPYYDLCPMVGSDHTYSGCVATAMAQVMKYHNWPDVGVGSNSYTWNGQTLSMNFAEQQFQWDKMTNTYASAPTGTDTEARAAVAQLMYACGISVDMSYGTGGSGAMSSAVPGAMVNNFKYGEATTMLSRDAFPLIAWENLIYESLKRKAPVYYSGQNDNVGHAFVCDGYDKDGYFHFNWGWGGVSDGYFMLSALDPRAQGIGGSSAGYNIFQSAIINALPSNQQQSPTIIFESQAAMTLEYDSVASTITVNGVFRYLGGGKATAQLGLSIEDENGQTTIYPENRTRSLRKNIGIASYTVEVPKLANGSYIVRPVSRATEIAGQTEWRNVYSDQSMPEGSLAFMDVAGNKVSFDYTEYALINATNLRMETTPYNNRAVRISFNLKNDNPTFVYGIYSLGIIDIVGSSASLVARSSSETIDLDPAQSKDITININFGRVVSGEHYMAVLQQVGNGLYICSDPIPVTFTDAPSGNSFSADNLVIENDNNVDCSDINYSFDLVNNGGYFAYSISAVVVNTSNGSVVAQQYYPYEYLNSGERKKLNYNLSIPGLTIGQRYRLSLGAGSISLGRATFTVGTDAVDAVYMTDTYGITPNPATSDATVTAPATIEKVEVYDMQGNRHGVEVAYQGEQAQLNLQPVAAGIYLVRIVTVEGSATLRLLKK